MVREEVEEEIVEWSGVGGGRSHEGVEEEVKDGPRGCVLPF